MSRAGSVVTKATWSRFCSASESLVIADAIVLITTWQTSGQLV